MAKYTGSGDFREVVTRGIRGGEVIIDTDQGELRFRVPQQPLGDTVLGRTSDNRMVALDLNEPDNIAVS